MSGADDAAAAIGSGESETARQAAAAVDRVRRADARALPALAGAAPPLPALPGLACALPLAPESARALAASGAAARLARPSNAAFVAAVDELLQSTLLPALGVTAARSGRAVPHAVRIHVAGCERRALRLPC